MVTGSQAKEGNVHTVVVDVIPEKYLRATPAIFCVLY